MNLKFKEQFEEKLEELNVKFFDLYSDEISISFSLDIWAKPGAKIQKNTIGPNGEIILYIKERPIDGAANNGLIKSLAAILSIPKSSIALARGSKSKFKRFSLNFTFTERKSIDYYLDQLNNLAGK